MARSRLLPGTAMVTRRLLEWWFEREEERKAVGRHFFFCQQEAVETVIFLYEVQGRRQDAGEWRPRSATHSSSQTGTGETGQMALLRHLGYAPQAGK